MAVERASRRTNASYASTASAARRFRAPCALPPRCTRLPAHWNSITPPEVGGSAPRSSLKGDSCNAHGCPYTRLMAGSPKRLSAGAVVVRETPQGWRFLLLRAFNHWDFPKGLVENGEDAKAAAVREVREETTVADLAFPWGDAHWETGPYSRGKTARYYLARTATDAISLPVNPEIGRPEHSEYRWVDLPTAMRLVSPRVRPVLDWAAQLLEGARE